MKAKKQFSIKKLLACVLSLAVIFSTFVFTSVSADTETVILDWSKYNGYSGGGFHFVKDDPTGYVHVTATDKELSKNSQIADLLNWWGWSAAGYDKIKFTAYTASGSCDVRMVYGDNVETANTTISATPTVVTYDVASTASGDVKFQLDAGTKGAIVSVDLYIGDVYGVVVEEAPAFPVTIDGAEQTYSGDQFTFPASTAAGFIAYTDGTNYYAANETVTITEAKDFTTVAYGALTMADGAAIRLSEKSGIRFYTPINAAKIAELKNMGATVELGTLIGPKDLVTSGLTFDLDEAKYANVPYLATTYFEDAYVVGSLVDIKEANSTREFVGRGYIKVTLGGVSATIYADYAGGSVDNNARSIASIATAYKNDNAGYAGLDEGLKALVDKWVAALENSNTVAGINLDKVEALGKATFEGDKTLNAIKIGMNQWDSDLTVNSCVKISVNGLTEGTISAYVGAGDGWAGHKDKGAHYGVEIDGVVYWDIPYASGEIKEEASTAHTFTGKNMYSLVDNSFSGSGTYDVVMRITEDKLASITAVYIRPGNHYNAQWVYVTGIK